MHSYYLLRLHILFYDWNRYRPQLTAAEPRSLLSCGPQWTCVRWSGMQNLVMKSTPDSVVPALFLGLGVESVAPQFLFSAVLLSVLFSPVLCCCQYCFRQCCSATSTDQPFCGLRKFLHFSVWPLASHFYFVFFIGYSASKCLRMEKAI